MAQKSTTTIKEVGAGEPPLKGRALELSEKIKCLN
jgi:hypothetical protein